jgi:hypothetical protein
VVGVAAVSLDEVSDGGACLGRGRDEMRIRHEGEFVA